jgi:hypothetical protein
LLLFLGSDKKLRQQNLVSHLQEGHLGVHGIKERTTAQHTRIFSSIRNMGQLFFFIFLLNCLASERLDFFWGELSHHHNRKLGQRLFFFIRHIKAGLGGHLIAFTSRAGPLERYEAGLHFPSSKIRGTRSNAPHHHPSIRLGQTILGFLDSPNFSYYYYTA